ncbi:hypothetical protein B0H21DRAFT_741651 [Amylocystis lapponica]|nr:hypothetical protein B0H21DRAFT_741651 [Amylocystis lapponica]
MSRTASVLHWIRWTGGLCSVHTLARCLRLSEHVVPAPPVPSTAFLSLSMSIDLDEPAGVALASVALRATLHAIQRLISRL